MKITWMTTASVILESEGARAVFDPFFPIPFTDKKITDTPFESSEAYKNADAVFLTHGHFDHILFVPRLYKDTDIPVYATKTPARTLVREGMAEGQIKVISPGDVLNTGPFRIKIYRGRHCVFDAGIIAKTVFSARMLKNITRMLEIRKISSLYPENGETVYYDIECDGKRTGVLGSLNFCDDVVYPAEADMLVLPFQGRSDIEKYALNVTDRFRPKAVFLDHFDDSFPPMSSEVDTTGFEEELKRRGIRVIRPESGRAYDV